MSDLAANGCIKQTNVCKDATTLPQKPQTIGEQCDHMLVIARQKVLDLCIKKAKLEALNMLDHPYHEMMDLMQIYPY